MSTRLRPYDELAQTAGLTGTVPGFADDTPVAKVISFFGANVANKAIQRLVMTGIVVWSFFIFFFIIPTTDAFNPFIIFPLFCLGPVIVGAIVIGGYTLLMSTLLGLPDVLMSAVLLKRGDTLQVHYKQSFKRNAALQSLNFTLVLKESATYDQGTSTVTETHDQVMDQIADFDVHITSDAGIDRQLSFKVPEDAMHSFEAYRNKLEWYLRVKIDIPNFPDFHRNYKLKVLPEVTTDES